MSEDQIETERSATDEVKTDPQPAVPVAPVAPIKRRGLVRPPKSQNELPWWLLLLVFALGLGSGWLLWGRLPGTAAPEMASGLQNGDVTRYNVPEAGNPSIGPEDAPVTIIEFSDFQCPYCKRWYDTVYAQLLTEYSGKIRFVYRDIPLTTIHPEAQAAAEAAECADEQGQYWSYHDALFSGQYDLGAQAYMQYAADLGMDTTAFNTCVAERRYKAEVDADAEFAASLNVRSTPTFFINGLAVIGAQEYEVFKQIIDKELAEAGSSQ